MEGMLVSSAACDREVACVSIVGVKDEPGVAAKIFLLLAGEHINIDLILQSIGRKGTKDITFVVKLDYLEHTLQVLNSQLAHDVYDHMVVNEKVAKVSIRGVGMLSNAPVASQMFEALYNVGINIEMIFTSEIKLTVLVNEDDMNLAYKAIRNKFIED